MSMQLNKIKDFFESPEGIKKMDELCRTIEIKEAIKQHRFKKFGVWLENNDFDLLLYKLILHHGDEYIENCYSKGYEPHPNNILTFIFDYTSVFGKLVEIKKFDNDFPNEIREFKGFYFQTIWGQGSFVRIHNKDDMRTILQL